MTKLNEVSNLYFRDKSKSLCQNIHQSVLDVIKKTGLAQEEELKAIVGQYEQDVLTMQDAVGLSLKLETTKTKKKLTSDVIRQYRYLCHLWQGLEYDRQTLTEEEYHRFQREVIDVFPLSILYKSGTERLGLLEVLLSHLRSDWMPLMERIGADGHVAELEKTIHLLTEADILKAEELSRREKGIAKRIMAEMAYNYHILMSYLEAWSNNWSEDEAIKVRHDKALSALNQINQLIAETKHGLAVAKSNRRRAKSQKK